MTTTVNISGAQELNLDLLENAMSNAVKDFGGLQESIDACDRMYNATFRSEKYRLDDVTEGHDHSTSLTTELATQLYINETGNKAPSEPYEDEYQSEAEQSYMFDSYYASVEAFESYADDWFANKYPDFKITDETLVVYFCNYKGEAEGGLGLYYLYKHLPVFVSKSESFNSVN